MQISEEVHYGPLQMAGVMLLANNWLKLVARSGMRVERVASLARRSLASALGGSI